MLVTGIVSIFCIAVVQRVVFRHVFSEDIRFDTYFHLYLIDAIRQQNHAIPICYPRLIETHQLRYPAFLHFVLSYFPPRCDRLVEKYLNPTLDAGVAAVTFALAYGWTSDFSISLAAGFLYIYCPLLFTRQSPWPRVNSFTPRLFGEVLVTAAILIFIAGDPEGGGWIWLLASLPAAAVYASSQFGIQALVLGFVGVAAVRLHPSALAVFIFGLAIAGAFMRRRLIELARMKIEHGRWYVRRLAAGTSPIARRNLGSGVLSHLRDGNLRGLYREAVSDNPLLVVLAKAPLIPAVLIAIAVAGEALPVPEVARSILWVYLALFAITSTKYFLFLGESERYLLSCMPIWCIAGASVLPGEVVIALIVYGVLFHISDFFTGFRYRRGVRRSEDDELISYLRDEKAPMNVATVPFHLGGWRVLVDTSHNWLSPVSSIFGASDLFATYEALDLKQLPGAFDRFDLDLVCIRGDDLKDRPISAIQTEVDELEGLRSFRLGDTILLVRRNAPDNRAS